jgi:hypothetical protein
MSRTFLRPKYARNSRASSHGVIFPLTSNLARSSQSCEPPTQFRKPLLKMKRANGVSNLTMTRSVADVVVYDSKSFPSFTDVSVPELTTSQSAADHGNLNSSASGSVTDGTVFDLKMISAGTNACIIDWQLISGTNALGRSDLRCNLNRLSTHESHRPTSTRGQPGTA